MFRAGHPGLETGAGNANGRGWFARTVTAARMALQVRAGNLQDLIYKQGQAGVTKASVSLVFDNSDPATSPLGYEAAAELTVTRQIALNGRSKYYINGRTAQQGAVQNMFQSVQLNVNNPHFIIMQGRITKVINMKPA